MSSSSCFFHKVNDECHYHHKQSEELQYVYGNLPVFSIDLIKNALVIRNEVKELFTIVLSFEGLILLQKRQYLMTLRLSFLSNKAILLNLAVIEFCILNKTNPESGLKPFVGYHFVHALKGVVINNYAHYGVDKYMKTLGFSRDCILLTTPFMAWIMGI